MNALTTILKAFLGVSSAPVYIATRNEVKPRKHVPHLARFRLNTRQRHESVNSKPTEYNRTHIRERNVEVYTFKKKPFQKDLFMGRRIVDFRIGTYNDDDIYRRHSVQVFRRTLRT